jgi:hypothetical protein
MVVLFRSESSEVVLDFSLDATTTDEGQRIHPDEREVQFWVRIERTVPNSHALGQNLRLPNLPRKMLVAAIASSLWPPPRTWPGSSWSLLVVPNQSWLGVCISEQGFYENQFVRLLFIFGSCECQYDRKIR